MSNQQWRTTWGRVNAPRCASRKSANRQSHYATPILILLLILQPASAFAQVVENLLRFYNFGEHEAFNDVYYTSDGGYILVGSRGTRHDQILGQTIIAKSNANGIEVWRTELEGLESESGATSVIESDNGDYIMVGYSRQPRRHLAWRLSSEGELTWRQSYDEALNLNAVIELKDGRFMFCGGPNGQIYLVDSDGEVIWRRENRLDVERVDLKALREIDGVIVISGWSVSNFRWRPCALKVRIDDGAVIWSRIYDNFQVDLSLNPGCMTSTGDGGFLVVAYRYVNQDATGLAFKISTDGDLIWQRWLFPGREQSLTGVVRLSDGGFALSGYFSNRQNFPHEPFLARLDANGTVLWTVELDFANDQRIAGQGWSEFRSITRTQLDEIVVCGQAPTRADNGRQDAFIMKFTSDILHAEFLLRTPEERDLWVMPGTSIAFEVRAEGDGFQGLRYEWFYEDSIIGRNAGVDVLFDSTGDFRISCRAEHNNNVVELDWMVHVRDLLITSHSPDTLSLTLRRNSEIDFSLDSVAYIGDSENLRYEWMIYDSAAVRWEEVAGDDRIGIRSYAFDRTGGFAMKARVFDPNVDPIPADSIQWNIQVRGVIRAYEPNVPEISLEPRQESTFELIPFNVNNDSIQFWWTLNGEEDTLSISSIVSISFQDTGRYVV
ncbi:MAG: hypothetical protein FJY67_11665, partial [Calditrichaeota bacterium]|nr:hypothetical protein [Calditrichota bacterium]